MAILMLRHTQPDVAPGTCYGQTDLDLADSFEHDLAAVLDTLPAFETIVTSPLKRCRRLAERIAMERGFDVRADSRLQEMDFGYWEAQSWNKIARAELDQWAADFAHARPHGGESVSDLKARVDAAMSDIRSTRATTLVVTHAGVIRAALAPRLDVHQFQQQIGFGELIRLPDMREVSG